MFLICNPSESKDEQILFLKTLLLDFDEKIYFVSEYEFHHPKVIHVPVRRILPSIPLLRGFLSPLASYINCRSSQHKNILMIHDELFSSTMIHAWIAKVFMNSKVMVYCAESMPYSFLQKLIAFFLKSFVDVVLCPSRDALMEVKRLGINQVWQCPLPTEPSLSAVRYTNHITRIGFFGKLVGQKGVLLLDEAMKEFPNMPFIVYGEGGKLKRLTSRQMSYRGTYTQKDLDKAFSEIDLLVVPSVSLPRLKEQFGRVVVEAMERGVLVIGSSSGAIPEVIDDPRLIFQENSVAAISEKIRFVLNLPEPEIIDIKKKLRKRFEDHFSSNAIKKVVSQAIKQINP